MRFLHLADLHIGKVLHRHSLIPDQKHILNQIFDIANSGSIDAVLIAGDVYQRSTPSPESMTVFSDFISRIAEINLPCYIVSGNHDSAERISYLSALTQKAGVFVANPKAGVVTSFPLHDAFGEITVHLLPFCNPLQIRKAYPEEADSIKTYEDAIKSVLKRYPVSGEGRHILVAHQFLTGGQTCESEELAVGGMDNISAELFEDYDYVALGHLHGPQSVLRPTVRYAGSPLKYSFSEVTQHKSVTIADVRGKGDVRIETVPLHPMHEMREITGLFDDLAAMSPSDDYIHAVLTDEEPPVDAHRRLRAVFPNLLHTEIRNSKLREDTFVAAQAAPEETDFLTLLRQFYAFQNNGAEMNENQTAIVQRLLEETEKEVAAL